MNDDEWSEWNRRYQETLPLFERSDPPVWWEGEALDYPVQKTLHRWMKE